MRSRHHVSQVLEGAQLRIWACAFLWAVLIGILAATAHAQNPPEKPTIDDVLWWLPPDTESLVVANGPFQFRETMVEQRDRTDQEQVRRVSPTEIRQTLQVLPLELLDGFAPGTFKALKGRKVLIVVQGSRHFRDPQADMEVMDFEGCSILVFDDELGSDGERLFKDLAPSANRTAAFEGNRILIFDKIMREAKWRYFVIQPRTNVLLIANNVDYLQTVLHRMDRREEPRAFPDDFPEWRYIDRDAAFWALRHYDPTQAALDQTSPFREQTAQNWPDPLAIGIVYSYDPRNGQIATITQLSGDSNSGDRAVAQRTLIKEIQQGMNPEVDSNSPAPGVLRLSWKLKSDEDTSYYQLFVLVGLGRGVWF